MNFLEVVAAVFAGNFLAILAFDLGVGYLVARKQAKQMAKRQEALAGLYAAAEAAATEAGVGGSE